MTKRKTHLTPKRGDAIKLVVKSNELVEARYMFNVWETRFFHTLISIIDKEDEDDKVYRVWFKDIKENFSINSNKSYELLREAARSLNRKPVYIGWQDDEYRRGREYTLFEFVDYLEEGQSGKKIHLQEYVDVKIQERMRPFLLYVKKNFDPLTTRYTSYDLRNTQKLKPYAIRIYELLKQFEFKGFRTIGVQDLKAMFLITDEYPRFSTFNQSVIAPSIKAINKYTDLYINPDRIERIKKGRRVEALRFPIESKTKQQVAALRDEPQQLRLPIGEGIPPKTKQPVNKAYKALLEEFGDTIVTSFGVTRSALEKVLKNGDFTRDAIEQAISVTRRARHKQEITKNPAGYFLKALKEGYTDVKQEAKKAQKERVKKAKQIEAQIDQLKQELSQKINEVIRVITDQDENITLQAIEAIRANTLTMALVKLKEQNLDRKLEVQDYRDDKHLRAMVINSIVQSQPQHFEPVYVRYHPQISALEGQLKQLKN